MAGFNGRNPLQVESVMPPISSALSRHPEYAEVFPIGSVLFDWATWSA